MSGVLAISESTRISRNPEILAAEVDGEVVMMSIQGGRYFGLDDIGSDIWKRIASPCSLGELIDYLVADYEADRAAIALDVRVFVERMAQENVLRLD